MNLEGIKINLNKSVQELKEMLKHPSDYQYLMPESLQFFETTEKGFKFSLKGMPEIALDINKTIDGNIELKSAKAGLDFSLIGQMQPMSDNKSEVQLVFKGNFNPFINMMVEKPLQNFINSLTDKIEKL